MLMILSFIFLQNSNGLTKVDSELAHLCGLLKKEYSNNHDSGYTYIDAISSESIPLTPFMIKEWARALVSNLFFSHINILKIDILLQYDRSVSVSHPPSTATFNPVNHRSSLHTRLQNPHHLKSTSTSASSQGTGISGDLAHILQIISSVVFMACIPSKPPTTPTHCCASLSASIICLPIQNTPSKLSQFLEYAEINLSVENTCLHEESL